MRRYVVVMAKAPQLDRVKTRLAREIGALAALRFHRVTTERLLRRLAADRRWTLVVAMTPGPRFRGRVVPQGRGDLGARMRRPLEELPRGDAVIVGSDIPGVTRGHVWAAFRALGCHDLVFGPAPDGGYWLVGARRRPLPAGLFRDVRWSSEHALGDTLAGIPSRFSVAVVATLEDVDDAGSLIRANAPGGAA